MIQARTRTNDVYATLRDRILSGHYRPSESLTEASLCADLGVSRTTIKRVLLMLVNEGLITIEQNKSAKVKAFTKDEILHLMDVRILLEAFVTRRAAEIIRDKELAKLKSILDIMEEQAAKKDLLEYSKSNKLFHEVIYKACDNPFALDMLQSIKAQIHQFDVKTILLPGRDERSFGEHRELYEATAAHDPERAAKAITSHVGNIKEAINTYGELLFI